jgi:hypothetical protein
MISKSHVLEHFGSVAKAAEFFNIAPQAIYQWEDGPIPRERELELNVRLPGDFPSNESPKPRRSPERAVRP